MGANAGPDIVSDGLVLALDAADNNSFRGEPTVNVINGGANRANVVTAPLLGNHAGISRSDYLVSYSSKRPHVFRCVSTNNTGYAMLNQQFSIQNQSGTTYTYSFEYKQLAGPSNSLVFSVVYPNGYKTPSGETAASNISNTQIDLEDGWKRWVLTYTCNNTGYNYIRFNLFTGGHLGTGDGDFDFYFDNFMLQEGSKRTRFVAGTRGTTVATGGGWADISGNSNHGEILNGTSTSNDNTVLGALDFDGTNDYIDLPILDNSSGEVTVEVVFKLDTLTGDDRILMNSNWWGPYSLWVRQSNQRLYWITGTSSSSYTATSATGYTPGNWYHAVGVRRSGFQGLYVNGTLVASNTSPVTMGSTVSRIPTVASGGTFDGVIPVVKAYNRALSASEVLQNYNSQKTRFGL